MLRPSLHDPRAVRPDLPADHRRRLIDRAPPAELLIDYRSGPIRFPKGWLLKTLIVSMELAAGREHFRNYRDFVARNGLPGLISSHGLSAKIEKVVSAGNMHAYVARK